MTGQVLADLLQITPIQRLHLVKSALSDAQV
jgi:Ran GTPase-activating protein (RanGAP) involved in mRNA processing and transport